MTVLHSVDFFPSGNASVAIEPRLPQADFPEHHHDFHEALRKERGDTMKFFLLSDNIDTQMGLRLAGIEGVVVHERHEVLEALEKAMHMEDVAVILITTKLVETCPDVISDLKLRIKKPLIEEIPDRHGSAKIGETIDGYVSEAIGVKL